jgi:hypothetical protein
MAAGLRDRVSENNASTNNGRQVNTQRSGRRQQQAEAPQQFVRTPPKLKTRKPTGKVGWPLILIEGEEKAGKTWSCAEFSASEHISAMYWLDLSEGSADEYGAIKGANYEIIDHDGSWGDIIGQVEAVHAEAQRAVDAGEKPVVLTIDSMTAIWEMLTAWTADRAARLDSNINKLRRNPDAEIVIPPGYWNPANKRHKHLMQLLKTFPGIVLVTAQGKTVTKIDEDGKPAEDERGRAQRDYKVEGQKKLAYDVSVWVRKFRAAPTVVVGARSVHAGIKPGEDEPKEMPGITLEHLIFGVLKLDSKVAHARNMPELTGAENPIHEVKTEIWALAQERGWELPELADDFAQWSDNGTPIGEAEIDALSAYLEQLRTPPATEASDAPADPF